MNISKSKKRLAIAISMILLVSFMLFALIGCKDGETSTDITYTLSKTELDFELNAQTETLVVMGNDVIVEDAIWESKNNAVAIVENGKVTAVGLGTAKITVGKFKWRGECIVTVNSDFGISITNSEIEDIDFGKAAEFDMIYAALPLAVADTIDLQVDYSKEHIDDVDGYSFISSDTSVATVDSSSGKITAIAGGIAVIEVASTQKKLQEVAEGMGVIEVLASATDEVIVIVGDDNTVEGKETFFSSLHFSDIGYLFTSTYNWNGFADQYAGKDTDTNTKWKKTDLKTYTGEIKLRINQDGSFTQNLGKMPRKGFISPVNEQLLETTLGEAKIKYGVAHPYHADGLTMGAFTEFGQIKIYGEKMYLVFGSPHASTPISQRIQYIGQTSDSTIATFKPFKGLVTIYDKVEYSNLTRTKIERS